MFERYFGSCDNRYSENLEIIMHKTKQQKTNIITCIM